MKYLIAIVLTLALATPAWAGITLYQTATDSTYAGIVNESCAAASSDGLGIVVYSTQLSKTQPAFPPLVASVSIIKKEINTGIIAEYPIPSSHNIKAGNWQMRFTTTSLGGNTELKLWGAFICLIRARGNDDLDAFTVSTLGSTTGQNIKIPNGRNVNISVNIPNDVTGLTYDDRIYLVWLIKNNDQIFNQGMSITKNAQQTTTIEEVGVTQSWLGKMLLLGKLLFNIQ